MSTNPPHQSRLPSFLYRVQHRNSFTNFNDDGFEAQGHYSANLSQWLTPNMVDKHLDWHDRSYPLSPFVSLFSNFAEAERRAYAHLNWNHQDVFIATISTRNLEPVHFGIDFPNYAVSLPVWMDQMDRTTFVSTADLRCYLGVNDNAGQLSEWLALDNVPRHLITQTQ